MFEFINTVADLHCVGCSLIGVNTSTFPVPWGNYFSVNALIHGNLYGDRALPVINMNKENFEHLIEIGCVSQLMNVRIYKKTNPCLAIVDERIPPEYYLLWTRGYCNSSLKENELQWVAENLTPRFTGLTGV